MLTAAERRVRNAPDPPARELALIERLQLEARFKYALQLLEKGLDG